MNRKPQSAPIMAEQMKADKAGTRLYKAVSDEHKTAMLANDIDSKINLLNGVFERGKVNLNELNEVKMMTTEYMQACKLAGIFPSFEGLATSFGMSRQALYFWVHRHPESDTAAFLEVVQTVFADILQNAALFKNADNILTIFLLKNSNLGYEDKTTIERQPYENLLGKPIPVEKLRAKYLADSTHSLPKDESDSETITEVPQDDIFNELDDDWMMK